MAALHNGQSVVVCARNTLRCVTKVVQVVPLRHVISCRML